MKEEVLKLKGVEVMLNQEFLNSIEQAMKDKIAYELGKHVRKLVLSRYTGRELSDKMTKLVNSQLEKLTRDTIQVIIDENSIKLSTDYITQRLEKYIDSNLRANKLINIANKLDDEKLDKLEKLLNLL